jgi:hypothetical protein
MLSSELGNDAHGFPAELHSLSDGYIYFLALLVVIEETDHGPFRVEASGSRLAGIMEKSHEFEECLSGYRFFDDFGKVLCQQLTIGRS